mmetsp:Transcript_45747/g.145795  ORF Transcript_45747/g.145795 Transcript_45747/m.145795 type:complete len:274 (+) Transcript_45747:995-1816(+)
MPAGRSAERVGWSQIFTTSVSCGGARKEGSSILTTSRASPAKMTRTVLALLWMRWSIWPLEKYSSLIECARLRSWLGSARPPEKRGNFLRISTRDFSWSSSPRSDSRWYSSRVRTTTSAASPATRVRLHSSSWSSASSPMVPPSRTVRTHSPGQLGSSFQVSWRRSSNMLQICTNSSYSISPLPSLSTWSTISCTSSSVMGAPMLENIECSSGTSTAPDPSASRAAKVLCSSDARRSLCVPLEDARMSLPFLPGIFSPAAGFIRATRWPRSTQ